MQEHHQVVPASVEHAVELVKVIEDDKPLKEVLLNPKVMALLRVQAMRDLLRQTLLSAAEDAAAPTPTPTPPPETPNANQS